MNNCDENWLINNSANGKTMEHLKVRFVNNAKDYKKYMTKPSFVSQKIFSKNFPAIQFKHFTNQSMLDLVF